ncbi:MAG: adenosine deaminase, partial [Streptococcus parasanguinis]
KVREDKGFNGSTYLTKEYALYHQHFQTKEADFYQHNVDAIQASFASEEEKQELLSKLEKAYADYL